MGDSLARKREGARVRIERIDGALATRLAELGLVPGSEVEVVRAIPFGGPLVLDRQGFRFAIRRVDAALVEVNPASAEGEVIIPPKPDLASAEGEVIIPPKPDLASAEGEGE